MEKLNLDNLDNVAGGQYDHDGPTITAKVIKATNIYSSMNVNSAIIRAVAPGDKVTIYRDPAMHMDGFNWRIVKREPANNNAYIDGNCLS
ncbi:MAG: hypothetical protein Q4D81_13825 [Eubacteriales bacterium]|nr:hypothetical protein [Eubacteriales bacterium]